MSAADVEYSWSEEQGSGYEKQKEKIAEWEEKLDREHLNSGYYRVVWESETKDYATSYTVVGFGNTYNENTVIIEGGRGGKYEIIPKPVEGPVIRYHHPSGKESQFWEESLIKFAVIGPEWEPYEEESSSIWTNIPGIQ